MGLSRDTMTTRFKMIEDLGTNTVEIDGEHFPYETTIQYVVRHEKIKRYAMYLRRGHNAFIFVRPLRKNGQIAQTKPFWTHSSKWYFVGKVQYCIALKPQQPPNNRLGKFLFKIFSSGKGMVPAYEWTDKFELWPEHRRIYAPLWGLLWEREKKEVQTGQAD
jgi:hypothetical protein